MQLFSVWGMNLDTLIAALNRGMDIAAAARGRDLVALGMPDTLAASIAQLADAYWGETPFTRKQATARQAGAGLSLEELLIIERHARRVKDQRLAWDLRVELCGFRGTASQLEAAARKAVAALRAPAESKEGVTVRRGRHLWTLAITAAPRLIADVIATLDGKDPVESFARNYVDGTARPTLTPLVVMQLDDFLEFEAGRAEDVEFRTDDGTTISGAELAQRGLAQRGYLATLHPMKGPVCAYDLERDASYKHRVMLTAELQRCVWKDCQCPASQCQIHHILAWKHGGQTVPRNLTFLCAYHNGVNDDDPGPPRRGRVERIGAKVAWISPVTGRAHYAN